MRAFRCVLAPILLALAIITAPAVSVAQIAIGVNITIEPPELPVYDQPEIPGPGYIWTPGYWAWGDDGYYWVPGTWVEPPVVGVLWTPGYWGWRDGVYIWNAGYWGPHIGFYGGIGNDVVDQRGRRVEGYRVGPRAVRHVDVSDA